MGFGQNALDLVNASNCSICILYPDGSYSNSSQFSPIITRWLGTYWRRAGQLWYYNCRLGCCNCLLDY
ncbi:hypothetical protein FOWG_18256 [Fusarium oxysporum f. sp. lycopersici MN25]|nr:hypothetical protein FOWG_18256 [Fusarium oxysporum f. sp. lycopersici MN25]